jgi:hypothetical protein
LLLIQEREKFGVRDFQAEFKEVLATLLPVRLQLSICRCLTIDTAQLHNNLSFEHIPLQKSDCIEGHRQHGRTTVAKQNFGSEFCRATGASALRAYESLMPHFKAVGQICSTNSLTHNLAQCRVVIQKAVAAGAKVISK